MDSLAPQLLELAHELLEQEAAGVGSAAMGTQAVFGVCARLREPLRQLVGDEGFRALLSRSLALSKVRAPMLEALRINPDGSLELSGEPVADLSEQEWSDLGAQLIVQLLGLLVTFIGSGLTLGIVHGILREFQSGSGLEGKNT